MKISKIEIENFRLLKKFSLDLENNLSLIVGKNNTGKTSFLTILDKFLNSGDRNKFTYNDFNNDFKKELKNIIKAEKIEEENYKPQGIKLKIFIEYNDSDNLENIGRVLMDLSPENNIIVLGFEYSLSYENLKKLKKCNEEELDNILSLENANYFKLNKYSFEYDFANKQVNEQNYINLEEEGVGIKDIINFKYISAKRDVANKENETTLSKLISKLYRGKERDDDKKIIENLKKELKNTDNSLNIVYKDLFKEVIEKVKNFGGIKPNETDIEITSTLQHRELLEGNTTIMYSHNESVKLPEHYNGLGYMNLISMIFEIEIKLQEFRREKDKNPADINLLFIEEPEAHTHPQMQYVFIKNIKKLLEEGINKEGISKKLQYIITTHSSHIVADSDFNDIKYLKLEEKTVIAKNLSDLKKQYAEDDKQYDFLKQYLTISRAEAFFVDKAVLIEGDTERILIPTFMKKLDMEEKEDYSLPLLSQNISVIEVGAYSQIFEKFINFLGIKSLIITDIDSVNENGACPVGEGTSTSNTALKHYLPHIEWNRLKTLSCEERTINDKYLICYQQEEDGYHARSFEDAFIQINKAFIEENINEFKGLKNKTEFKNATSDAYNLAQKCIAKKTHFALDILYHSDENFSNWKIPKYIKEGLLWLKKD